MKKLIALIMAMIMCLGCIACLASCEPAAPAATGNLENAKDYVFNMYKGSAGKDQANKIEKDLTVITSITIEEVVYTVDWTLEITAGGADSVKLTDGANSTKVVDVPDTNEEQIEFTLKATVKDPDGNSASLTFKYYIPVRVEQEIDTTQKVVIQFSDKKDDAEVLKYVTGTHYLYTSSSSGNQKWELKLTENKAEALAMTVQENDDGTVSFVAEGKYLFCDANHVQFVDEQGDNTKFVMEPAAGGSYIKCAVANYNGKPQYLEMYSGYLTCYGMTTDEAKLNLYSITLSPADETVVGTIVIPEVEEEETTEAETVDPSAPVLTPEEIVNAAYALEPGASMGTQTLTGVVTEVNTAYNEQYKNVTFTIVVGALTDKPIECFRAKGEAAATVKAGDTITITGELLNYVKYEEDGTTIQSTKVEFNAGATFIIGVPEEETETDKSDEDIVNEAYALEPGATLGTQTLTGVVTEVNTAYSEQYKNVTFTIVVAGLTDKPIECFRAKGDAAATVKAGDTITITGELLNYVKYEEDGTTVQFTKVEFNAGATFVIVEGEDAEEDTEAETGADKTDADIVNEAYALAPGATMGTQTLTGVVTEVNTAYSEQYKNVTFTIVVAGLTDKPIECFRAKGDAAATVKAGDTITITGELLNYVKYESDGTTVQFTKVEFNAGATFVIVE